jgi:RHS repeat-associated protein
MPTAAKEEKFCAPMVWTEQCVLPLAAAAVYPKTRVWGSKPENVHCSSATLPLNIELRWGCEESSEKSAVGSGVSFKYDPFGRRIYKSSSSGTSIYAYDVDNIIEEVNSSGTAVARYVQTQNIDEPLAMLRSSATSYYHADGLDSITSLSNPAGSVVQTYTFDSFGKQTSSTGSLTNPFQYTAREFDTETSLYFYRARYYDPSTGRFLSEDPLGFLPGENFYRYVDNNPVFWRDASGLSSSSPIAVLVPSLILPGRFKLEGNLDPLCQKGRNIGSDAQKLVQSIGTRQGEIQWYANHPDPNMKALAGDPGHLQRIENELEALARCRGNDPDCEPQPERRFVPFTVPDAWKRQPVGAANATAGVALLGIIFLIGLAFAL